MHLFECGAQYKIGVSKIASALDHSHHECGHRWKFCLLIAHGTFLNWAMVRGLRTMRFSTRATNFWKRSFLCLFFPLLQLLALTAAAPNLRHRISATGHVSDYTNWSTGYGPQGMWHWICEHSWPIRHNGCVPLGRDSNVQVEQEERSEKVDKKSSWV